jgi:hypothetical protein
VISPEQQDDDGEFLLVQFEVIAWADEKKQRRRRTFAWAGLILVFFGKLGGNWGISLDFNKILKIPENFGFELSKIGDGR